MRPPRWYLTWVKYEDLADGLKVIAITTSPCHLYMRHSLVDPKIHPFPVVRRGLIVRDDVYFCFDVYDDNEQDEPGDTLVHTFTKHGWPVCQTWFFYFHGTVNDVVSPSTSAIFSKHRLTPPPGPTNDCQTDTPGGPSWCHFWNASSQTFEPDHPYVARSLHLCLNQYATTRKGPYRVILAHDTAQCWMPNILWQHDGYSTDLPLPNTKEWVSYDLPNIPCAPHFLYRIIVHTTPGWLEYYGGVWRPAESRASLAWWQGDIYHNYPRGYAWYGCNLRDSRGSWTQRTNVDHAFCVYA